MENDCIKQIMYRKDLLEYYTNRLQKLNKDRQAYKTMIKICKAQIKNLEDKFYGL